MKRAIRVFLWVGIGALSFAPWASAQSVTLTSPGNNVADGVYVSPYYATVNGATNTPIVCDDFADNSHLNMSWTGNIQSFSSLASSLANTAWGAAPGVTFKTYEEAAWLTMTLLQQPSGSAGQVDYSYAVWAVFDPSGVISWLKKYGDTATCNAIFGTGNDCLSTNVTGGLLGGVPNSYATGEFANVVIITPMVGSTTCTAGSCPEQEFIEMVPEGGAALAYLFLAGVCCFGAMFLRSRRQTGTIPAA